MKSQIKIMNLIRHLTKYRFIAFWILILALFGYSLWRIQALSNPAIDQAYIVSQQKSQTTKVQISDSLRQQLEELQGKPITVKPQHGSRSNPFSP